MDLASSCDRMVTFLTRSCPGGGEAWISVSSGDRMVTFETRSRPGGGEAWISLVLVIEWSHLRPGPAQEAGRPEGQQQGL